MALPRVLKTLLNPPTAPFLETAVLTHIEQTCRQLAGVRLRTDRYGNLLAHYRRDPGPARPLAFVAHTDHPGFFAQEMLDRRTLRAGFRGGVRPEYFPGSKARFWSGGRW